MTTEIILGLIAYLSIIGCFALFGKFLKDRDEEMREMIDAQAKFYNEIGKGKQ